MRQRNISKWEQAQNSEFTEQNIIKLAQNNSLLSLLFRLGRGERTGDMDLHKSAYNNRTWNKQESL